MASMPQVQAQLSLILLTSTRRGMACARRASDRFHTASSVIGKAPKARILHLDTAAQSDGSVIQSLYSIFYRQRIPTPASGHKIVIKTSVSEVKWRSKMPPRHMTFTLWWHWTLKRRKKLIERQLIWHGWPPGRPVSSQSISHSASYETLCV